MLTCRSFSTAANPDAATSCITRIALSFTIAWSKHGQVRVPVKSGRIDDAIWLVGVVVKSHRPSARQSLIGCFRYIGRNTHDDGSVVAQIDHLEWGDNLNLGITARKEFPFVDRQVADYAVTPITQHCLEKANRPDRARQTCFEECAPSDH